MVEIVQFNSRCLISYQQIDFQLTHTLSFINTMKGANHLQIHQMRRNNSLLMNKQNTPRVSNDRLSMGSITLQENSQGRNKIEPFRTIKNDKIGKLQIKSCSAGTKMDIKNSSTLKLENSSHKIERKYRISFFKKTQSSNERDIVMDRLQNIIRMLEDNLIISEKPKKILTIKKEDLIRLLNTVMLFKQPLMKQGLPQINVLDQIISQFSQITQVSVKKGLAQKLRVVQAFNEKYSNIEYQAEIQKKTTEISHLQLIRNTKLGAISELQESLANSYIHKQAIGKLITQKKRYLYDLQHKCHQQQTILVGLEASTAQKQEFYVQALKNQQSILNFVQRQDKSQIMKLVSENYKQIESDIYEYASYLQANELASSLSYQHLPIICHTYNLDDQVAALSKSLIQDNQVPLLGKCRKVRDFLMNVMQRYRKKDLETANLMEFKTKCIINFVEKMKKWLNNWELKQEYLKNLRIEHGLIYSKVDQVLEKLSICQRCNHVLAIDQQNMLKELLEKMNENFKMGNSFY